MPTFAPAATALEPIQTCAPLNYYHDIDLTIAPALKSMTDFMADTLKAQKAFIVRRGEADYTVTEFANKAAIEAVADKLNTDAMKKWETVNKAVTLAAANAEEELAHKTDVTPTPEAAEIRSVLLNKGPAERAELVRQAFADDDRTAIAAMAKSHKWTTGIDADLMAAELDRWKARVAPNEYRAVAEYQKALGYHANTQLGLMRWYPKSKTGTNGYIKAQSEAATILNSYGVTSED
jgi:hypothetical protein